MFGGKNLKEILKRILALLVALSLFTVQVSFLEADGNIDGSAGDLGKGNKYNYWLEGQDGVRVSVVNKMTGKIRGEVVDYTNRTDMSRVRHFGKVSKLQYRQGVQLNLQLSVNETRRFEYQSLPLIIPHKPRPTFEVVKKFFTEKNTLKEIADNAGLKFSALVSGRYEVLIEPIAYFMFGGVMYGMTATEVGLYNPSTNNQLRYWMGSLTHQQQPLSMYPREDGTYFEKYHLDGVGRKDDNTIVQYLGVGIITFNQKKIKPPVQKTGSYDYRTDTDVFTSVEITAGRDEFNRDSPASVTFTIEGKKYTHSPVYIPEGGSALAWVKWRTPKRAVNINIGVETNTLEGSFTVPVSVGDPVENIPPDPWSTDEKPKRWKKKLLKKPVVKSRVWGWWDCWWEPKWVLEANPKFGTSPAEPENIWVDRGKFAFEWKTESASLSTRLRVRPDDKVPTAQGKMMGSGYGFNARVYSSVNSSSGDVTRIQTGEAVFPEFGYTTYNRILEKRGRYLEFQKNKFSHFERRVHFTPIWFPDGDYDVYVYSYDCWTPAGMLSSDNVDEIEIYGTVFDDWGVTPVRE